MRLLAWAAAAAFVFLSSATIDLSAQEDSSKIKSLAPGVLKVIPTILDPRDSYSLPMNLPGLSTTEYQLNYKPQKDTLHEIGQKTIFFRNVWQYEFAFTGLRQVNVVLKYPDGTTERKNIWYMIYRVRDLGKSLSYDTVRDQFGHTNHVLQRDQAVTDRSLAADQLRLHFTLQGQVKPSLNADYETVTYGDMGGSNTVSLAKYIQSIEDPNQKLFTKRDMKAIDVPLAQSDSDPGVWGVAMWENVNPKLDYVSVYVRGLTNAYRIHESADGRTEFTYKTLQLNFWRAGDEVAEERDNVDFGIPLVDKPDEQVNICRHYNLPAPVLRGYVASNKADQKVLVTELDAQVNLVDFTSLLTPKLDGGEFPQEVADAFSSIGVNTNGAQLKTTVPGEQWTFTADGNNYTIKFEPQFWKPARNGIEFTKSLDHFWIYR